MPKSNADVKPSADLKRKSNPKRPKLWSATVNLDRLEPETGHWRITTGKTKDMLPREVATDPGVRGAIVAWMTAHRARTQPSLEATQALSDAIRASVTAAFRAKAAAEAGS